MTRTVDPATQTPDSIFGNITQLRDSPGALLMARNTSLTDRALPTYRDASGRIRDLLDVNLERAAELLGVSRASAAKNTPLSVDALDRIHSLSVNFEQAQAVFGEQTVGWFTAPHPALEGLSPLDMQRTRYGERRLSTLIQNMLDGAFL